MEYSDKTKDKFINEKLQEKLCESEKFFSQLLACAPIVMFVLDPEGVFMFLGGKAMDKAGLKHGEFIGRSAFEVYRDKPEIVENVRRALAGEEVVFNIEMAGITCDGQLSPLCGPNGEIVGVVGFATDTTERKKIEEEFRLQQEHLQLQIDRMPVGCIVWNPDFRVMSWNPAAERIFGFTSQEAMGKHPYDFIVPKHAQLHVDKIWGRLIEGDLTANSINDNFTKDGRTILCEWTNTPLRQANGVVIGVLSMVQDITEIRRTEEILHRERIEQQIILNSVPAMIFYKDTQNRMLHVNRAFVEAMGMPKESIEGKTCFELWPEDAEHYWSDDKEVIQSGQPKTNIIEFLVTVRGRRWLQTDKIPYRDEQGNIIGIIGFAVDITEHRKEQDALRESEAKFKTIFENSVSAIFIADAETGELVDCNSKAEELIGRTRSEIIGMHQTMLHPEGEAEKYREQFALHTQKRSVVNDEGEVLHKDGRRIPVWISANAMKIRGREALVGFFYDITERKRIQDALQESENKFRRLTEKSLVGIYLIQDGIFKYVNPRLAEIFGYSVEEIVDKKGPKDLTHPEDLPVVEENIRKRISGEVESVYYAVRGLTKDKKIIYFEVYGTRIDYHNEPAIIGTLLDITERKKVQEALEKNERFLSDVFHSIQDGISVLGKEMNIVRVNATMEEWYAHAMPLVGKKCYEAYHCRNSPCKVCPTIRTLNTAKPAYEVVPKKTAGGQIVGWLDLYSYPLFDTQTGEIKGVIEYVRDITKQRRIEAERERLYKELIKTNKKLKQLALRDPHTGLYNYHYLTEAIEAEFHRARRYAHSLSVIMLDIDYFKSINDVYGHNFGDLVLKQLAKLLKKMVRRYDVVVRSGGEEFVVISPGTDRATALVLAQRTLDAISLYNFGDKGNTIKLKLSLAVASYPEDRVLKGIELIELADQILSKVKEYGGNKVYSSQEIKKKKQPLLGEKKGETTEVKSLKERIDKLTKRANQSLIESVFAFAKTIELKDHYSGEHVERTVHYATEISQALKLPKEEIERVREAAILHDLGKVGISEKILLKKSKLTTKEFEEIKKHPQIGVDIIRPIQFLHSIIPLMLYHHERWDGKGYPTGLKGEDIPIGARVIAIADVFQALTSDRPYRKAYSEEKAVKIIKEGSGTQFDPKIVKAFFEVLEK